MGIRDLFFSITAKDNTATAFSTVNKKLRETAGYAATAGEKIDRLGARMRRAGAAGSIASAGIIALFRDSIGLYDEQSRAEAKVAQAIKATGGAAGFTTSELKKQASAMQGLTRLGDERILNEITAQLLTFKNISGDAFKRAQWAAADLSTVLDGNLKSASIILGKALNDPINGLSALSKAGATFSTEQQKVIKDLAKTGHIAQAQRLILDELASAYGGQAKAARAAGTGILAAWSNTWGDMKEIVGGVLLDLLRAIVPPLESMVAAFQNLDPKVQKTIVIFGALAVAIPPVLAALGLLVAGIAALGGPLTAIIAGVAAGAAALAAFWPHANTATSATDDLTRALGSEITQSQLLAQALGTNAQMSVQAARKKLAEAEARHENVRAIIAEQRALALNSDAYKSLTAQISAAQGAVAALGFPASDTPALGKTESFENAQKTLVDLLKKREALLKMDSASADQLKRTEKNIADLKAALAAAKGGVVTFGDGLIVPIKPAAHLGGALKNLTKITGDTKAAMDGFGRETSDMLKGLFADGKLGFTNFGDFVLSWGRSFLDRLLSTVFNPLGDALQSVFDAMTASAGSGGGFLSGVLSGFSAPATAPAAAIPGFATGGAFTVGGRAGIDRNLATVRLSRDENVQVTRRGDRGASGRPVIVNIQTPNPEAFRASRAQIGAQLRAAVAAGERGA